MKGYRFYEEFVNKRKGISAGNVVAVSTDVEPLSRDRVACVEGFEGIFDAPNSPVNWGGVGLDYLRFNCKRVSEARARTVHPALFERLDE